MVNFSTSYKVNVPAGRCEVVLAREKVEEVRVKYLET